MTTSCIIAHLTYMNIDYSYFAGKHQPHEILIKYLRRGYGTYLNWNELNTMCTKIMAQCHEITRDTFACMKELTFPLFKQQKSAPKNVIRYVDTIDTVGRKDVMLSNGLILRV